MPSDLAAHCWEALKSLRAAIKRSEQQVDHCSFAFGEGEQVQVWINSSAESASDRYIATLVLGDECPHEIQGNEIRQVCFKMGGLHVATQIGAERFPTEIVELIRAYSPYCLAKAWAQERHRAMAVTHFAQTLDGKIATVQGDSKWIGNQKNLVHAHRMRALCDAVLVGATTLKRDHPELTVRNVSGPDPIRIVLTSSPDIIHDLVPGSSDPMSLMGVDTIRQDDNIRVIELERKKGVVPPLAILRTLYEKGIYSVYIEGGSITASLFLLNNVIDVLQLHISPLILGSGISSFALPEIKTIKGARRFAFHDWFPMGDGIMFLGSPKNGRRQEE